MEYLDGFGAAKDPADRTRPPQSDNAQRLIEARMTAS